MAEDRAFAARILCGGSVEAPALVSHERMSFHMQTRPREGIFVGPTEETADKSFVNKVVIFRSGRGASPGARILDTACRCGNRPAAVVNIEAEPIMIQGCALEDIPFALVEDESILDYAAEGDMVTIDAERELVIVSKP